VNRALGVRFRLSVLVACLAGLVVCACTRDRGVLQPGVPVAASLGVGQFTIEIDATALSAPQLTLSGIGTFASGSVQSFDLDAGAYLLYYLTGAPGPAVASVNFTVTASGMIDFDPALNGILAGRGSSRLLVHGTTLRYDATALSAPLLFVLEGVTKPSDQPYTLTLLPGIHILLYRTGALDLANSPTDARVQYTVSAASTLDFDPALDRIMEGRGTSSLLVHGLTIQYDATALSAPLLFVLEVVTKPSNQPYTLTLLPGIHILLYRTGAVDPVSRSLADARVQYSVTGGGSLDFDLALDGILEGRGTNSLRVNGVAVRIDVTCMQFVTSSFGLGPIGTFSTDVVHSFRLLPGIHPFRSDPLNFDFTVTVAKTVVVNAALAPQVTVRDGTTLLVRVGAEAQIDRLISLVEGLKNQGTLNDGRANSLNSKLGSAKGALGPGDRTAARGQLEAFGHEVDALEQAGILSADQAEMLRTALDCALDFVAA